jgi:hypothetical protein
LSSPKRDRSPPRIARRRREGETPLASSGTPTQVRSPRYGDAWWQRGVVYQIYPRSFADTSGDGVGDFQGMIDHLDHLGPDGLDVDAIWLSPIYPSPGLDVGYDVSDHAHVDPLFGTEEDFDRHRARWQALATEQLGVLVRRLRLDV